MAIDRLNDVPVADEFFSQVDVVQVRSKTEFRDGQEVEARNKSGECGWVVDALVRTETGVRTISWTVWGTEPTYSGPVKLRGVRAAPWATAPGNVRPKTGLWLSVGSVEPTPSVSTTSRRPAGGDQNAG
ncbi:Uncharacterised protein [Mycobacteroides abscessus subsp. bolletii]|nr:Uncharacterised protein [Mycobacteroides abscessus subsp. bolletii]SLD45107.1 Uncharacterised protein [Mycobacteroides abscessus subsp. bolletii]